MGTAPPKNLPPESIPYINWLEGTVLSLQQTAANNTQNQTNSVKSQIGTTQTLAQQIQGLQALTTTSRSAATFNTGTTPGDSTWRFMDPTSGVLSVPVVAKTGKVLVTIGSGQTTLNPGNSTATAAITFQGSSPSGWTYALSTVDSRVFCTSVVQQIGIPLIVSTSIAVPATETVTFTMKFGIWSSSATTLASANFGSPYMTVQVIN